MLKLVHFAIIALLMTNARISLPGAGPHFFWQIAASPTNPNRLVACSLRESPDTAHFIEAILYGSSDAGETWHVMKSTSEFPNNSETSCAMSGGSGIYFTMSVGSLTPKRYRRENSRMYLWHSTDFGKTWKLSPRIGYSDAAMLLVKRNAAGRDRVFDFANRKDPGSEDRYLTIFDNDATTIKKLYSWNPAPAKPGDPLHCGVEPKRGSELFDVAALPARPGDCINGVSTMHPIDLGAGLVGGLYTDWTLKEPRVEHLTFTRVTDDGRPIGSPSTIALLSAHLTEFEAMGGVFSGHTSPALAFGRIPGSTRHRLYTAWQDIVDGRIRILLAHSDDLGKTWSPPHSIDDAKDRQQDTGVPMPADTNLAVNSNGLLAVSWAEFSGQCWRIAFSKDGGENFSSSVPLNPCDAESSLNLDEALARHLFVWSKDSSPGLSIIDFRKQFEFLLRGTSLTAAADGTFYALWTQLGGFNDELHVTHIVPDGYASPLAARRKNIIAKARCCLKFDDRTKVYFTSYDYDPATREIAIGMVLVRERTVGKTWPIVVRLKTIESAIGPLQPSNADNLLQGTGAAWVFDGPGGKLPTSSAKAEIHLLPSKTYVYSTPRVLRFRIEQNLKHYSWNHPPKPEIRGAFLGRSQIINADLELLSVP